MRSAPRILPASTSRDARMLLFTRAARGFADGVVSVLLASYLGRLGFTPLQIGAVVTATLLGSAFLTLGIGLLGHRFRRRAVLLGAAGLMVATGLGFAGITSFWPLLIVAFVGTLNPSSGDVSVFLPLEHAVLSRIVDDRRRTAVFARYSLVGALVAALGALCAGTPEFLAATFGITTKRSRGAMPSRTRSSTVAWLTPTRRSLKRPRPRSTARYAPVSAGPK